MPDNQEEAKSDKPHCDPKKIPYGEMTPYIRDVVKPYIKSCKYVGRIGKKKITWYGDQINVTSLLLNGKLNGRGNFSMHRMTEYNVDFIDDVKTGIQISRSTRNGEIYITEFCGGVKHGK